MFPNLVQTPSSLLFSTFFYPIVFFTPLTPLPPVDLYTPKVTCPPSAAPCPAQTSYAVSGHESTGMGHAKGVLDSRAGGPQSSTPSFKNKGEDEIEGRSGSIDGW